MEKMNFKRCTQKKYLLKRMNGLLKNEKYYLVNTELNNPFKYLTVSPVTYYVSKRNGELFLSKPDNYNSKDYRMVNNASPRIKAILKIVLKDLKKFNKPKYLQSCENKDYFKNACQHKGNNRYIVMDLSNFFDTCTFKDVKKFFMSSGNYGMNMPSDIANIFSLLCTVKKENIRDRVISQGYPTSPLLSFLTSKDMFDEIDLYAKRLKITFTCYVDDITFSYNKREVKINEDDFISNIKKIVEKYDKKINNKKTRIGSSAIVTGIYCKNYKIRAGQNMNKKYNVYYKKISSSKITDKESYIKYWIDFNTLRGLHNTITKYIEKRVNLDKPSTDFQKKVDKLVKKENKLFPQNISPLKIKNERMQEELYKCYKRGGYAVISYAKQIEKEINQTTQI